MRITIRAYPTSFLIYSCTESEHLVVSVIIRKHIDIRSSNSYIVTGLATIMLLISRTTMISIIIILAANAMSGIGTASYLHHTRLVFVMAKLPFGLETFPAA